MVHSQESSIAGEKAPKAYWEATHSQPRWRLPSRLIVATRNILRLLGTAVEPGMRVLEIGCAPGKHLAYLAKVRQARVCGLDYSEPGIAFSRELFSRLGLVFCPSDNVSGCCPSNGHATV
jgi:cyclopropane fatty-acyl-phospholipid synthase-like methyltransferase